MSSKNSAWKILRTSLSFFVASFLLAWFIGDSYSYSDNGELLYGPLVVSLIYLLCCLFLFFFNETSVRKWFSHSLRWTVPLLILFLIVSSNVINAGSGESDFLSYELLYIPLLAVSAFFVLYTPFYLHKKSKEFSNPTN